MYSKRNKKHPKQNTKNINCRDRGTTKAATALPCCTFWPAASLSIFLVAQFTFSFPVTDLHAVILYIVCLYLSHFIFLAYYLLYCFSIPLPFYIFFVFWMGAIYLPFSFLFSLFPPSFPSICTYRCICRCSKIFTDILMGAI